ncbi:tyrosine-type recombinase/integrase [Planctomycetota bacterium]
MGLYKPKYTKNGKVYQSKTWYYEYRENKKRHRINLRTTDKSFAQQRLADVLRDRDAGNSHATTRTAPLEEIVKRFARELERKGRTKKHVKQTESTLTRLFDSIGARRASDLSTERITEALSALSHQSPRTQNYTRGAASAFFEWLVKTRQWQINPVRAIGRVREDEPTVQRRALEEAELEDLLKSAPVYRAVTYLTAATTGLRRSELASIARWQLDFDEGTVLVRAGYAKNRKEAVIPLPPRTAKVVRAWCKDQKLQPRDRVFVVPRVKTFYRDLERTGVERMNEEGQIDFHALRATFATSLARKQVPLALAQRLMRHSDPKLTANHYTKLQLHDKQEAAAKVDVSAGLSRALSGALKRTRGQSRIAGKSKEEPARKGVAGGSAHAISCTREKAKREEREVA